MIAQPTIEAVNPRRNNAMEDGSTLPQQGGAELAASSRYVIFRNRSCPGRPSNFPTDPGRALIQAEQCDGGRLPEAPLPDAYQLFSRVSRRPRTRTFCCAR